MEIPPDIDDTTVFEKIFKRGRTVTRGDGQATTRTIQGTVKNFVEIPTKNCRDRGINLGMKINKELVPCRVAVGAYTQQTRKDLPKKENSTCK